MANQITNRTEVTDVKPVGSNKNVSDATIAPNLRADLMRKQMESKNTLTHKGSLYVGVSDNINTDTGVYSTKELSPKQESGSLKSGFLGIKGTESSDGYDVDYFQPFSYNPTTGILTITWYEPDENNN